MTAPQTIHAEPDARTINRLAVDIQRDRCGGTASTGNSEDTLILRIQVNHFPTLEHGHINDICTQHSNLLIHSDNNLQRRMGNGSIRNQCHCIGNSNAVIAAQRCSLCKHAKVIMTQIKPLRIHINGAALILLADHIHMPLKHYRLVILQAAGTVGKQDDVIALILDITNLLLLCKIHQKIADCLRIVGTVGNCTQRLKIFKYSTGLQPSQLLFFHKNVLLSNGVPLRNSYFIYHFIITPVPGKVIGQNSKDRRAKPCGHMFNLS